MTEEKIEETKEEVKEQDQKTDKKEKKQKKSETEILKEKIASLEHDLKRTKDDYLKELASLQTMRTRLKEEAETNKKYAPLKVIEELLTPIDMLVNIIDAGSDNPEIQNYLIGFKMIADQLMQVLVSAGLKKIECKEEDVFDSELMEALTSEIIETEEAKVLKVLRPGYKFIDRVIRPVSVHVGIKEEIKSNEEEKGE